MAEALAVLLSRAGFRVYLVDSDPRASITTAFGLTDSERLLYQAMCRRGPLPVVMLLEKLSISLCNTDLSRAETQFIAEAGREYILQNCLEKANLDEDTMVILDCPPSLGVLSIGCLTAARYACVVVQPSAFELRTTPGPQRESDASHPQRTDRGLPGLVMGSPVPTHRTCRAGACQLPRISP